MPGTPPAFADSPGPNLFDARTFSELSMGRPALQRELIELFVAEGRKARASLPALAVQGSEPFRDVIHALLGSARIVAAVQLCGVLEQAHAQAGWSQRPWREALAAAAVQALDAVEPVLLEFAAGLRGEGDVRSGK
jgi:HPt (histidine-containing phosphotransfer) domain-containing protein